MTKTKIQSKAFTMTTWSFKRLAVVWSADKERGQYGFCYSPRLALNIFLGKRSLSFQPSESAVMKQWEKPHAN